MNNNWQTKTLQSLGTFHKGTGIPRDSSYSGKLPAVRYGELYTDYDTFISEKTRSRISEDIAKDALKLEYGDLLLAGSGETPEDIGKSAVFLLNEGYAGGDIIVFRPDKTKVNPKFLALYFETEPWKKQRRRVAQGQSIVHIHTTDLKKMIVELPDLETQQKIVHILDTINAEITLTKNLIQSEKKTFYGLLQIVSKIPNSDLRQLGDIAIIKKGAQLNKESLLAHGIPVINGGIEPSGYTNDSNAEANTITISEGGNSCGFVSFQTEPFWSGGHCYTIKPNKINKKLLYFILKDNERRIKRLRVGSGLPNIQKEDLKKIKINIPSSNEHEKIVTLLNTSEDKINVLSIILEKELLNHKYLLNHLISGDFDLTNIKLENGKEQQ